MINESLKLVKCESSKSKFDNNSPQIRNKPFKCFGCGDQCKNRKKECSAWHDKCIKGNKYSHFERFCPTVNNLNNSDDISSATLRMKITDKNGDSDRYMN
ncbi:hypothetical protein A3Q56_08049 [Intoshia linei]|uniref:Uncharacterized protein n=1 Tax=Intoshia linei TaxID=1819745 RepID=A0A177AQG8_9BILA|nr:hypothetical protein A3Q56_08049 [Intoshia linei]